MTNGFFTHVREKYKKIIDSIAFNPAVIAISFLLLSILMLEIDFSETGKHIKSQLSWLSLRDASTARLVIEAVCANKVTLGKVGNTCNGYINKTQIPKLGVHVKVTGSLVIDTHNGWAEIHPIIKLKL